MATVVLGSAAVNAYGTITVLDYTLLAGQNIYVDGKTNTEGGGGGWTAATSNDATAASIKTALDGIAGTDFTTAVNGSVVTVTSTTVGAAGNGIINLATDVNAGISVSTPGDTGTLRGGVDAVAAAGLISAGRIRLSAVVVKSDSAAGSVQVFNGSDANGTEFDLITGTASKAVVRNYNRGLVLGSCYVSGDSDVTQISVQFTAF